MLDLPTMPPDIMDFQQIGRCAPERTIVLRLGSLNYRAILLVSTISKVKEKATNVDLINYLEIYNIINGR